MGYLCIIANSCLAIQIMHSGKFKTTIIQDQHIIALMTCRYRLYSCHKMALADNGPCNYSKHCQVYVHYMNAYNNFGEFCWEFCKCS